MKRTNFLILIAITFFSLILVSGTLAAASASRNAVMDAITPDEEPAKLIPDGIWEKYIDVYGTPVLWSSGITFSVETSDTIIVEDVVFTELPIEYSITENWNPDELELIDVINEPGSIIIDDRENGYLEWIVEPAPGQQTLTKTFHVRPCNWQTTVLQENLTGFEDPFPERNVVFDKIPPDLWITATYDTEVSAGGSASFTLEYGNNGGYENDVAIFNTFPITAPFASSEPAPTSIGEGGVWANWLVGDLANGDMNTIDVTVDIDAGLVPSTTIDIWDYIIDHVRVDADSVNIQFHVQDDTPPQVDLGDAPDSTNHFPATPPMTAYPKGGPLIIPADYPTVFDPATGLPQGPLHLLPEGASWLGPVVSLEVEADILADSDGPNNIDPTLDLPDQDGFDDGLHQPVLLPHCVSTQLTLDIFSIDEPLMYINVWFDWYRNGDWRDQPTCSTSGDAPEWAVQNQPFSPPGPGLNTIQTSAFLPYNTSNDPIWMRVTLSDQPAPPDATTGLVDGQGPAQGYLFGETEDYYLENTNHTLYLPLILKAFTPSSAWHMDAPPGGLYAMLQSLVGLGH